MLGDSSYLCKGKIFFYNITMKSALGSFKNMSCFGYFCGMLNLINLLGIFWLKFILLKTQPAAIISEIPLRVMKSKNNLALPADARKKPPATVIKLPKIIPGLVIEIKFFIKTIYLLIKYTNHYLIYPRTQVIYK